MQNAQDPQSPQQPADARPDLLGAASKLVDIAQLWAHHGLRVSKLAVETGAKTLERTASFLDSVAQTVKPADAPKE